MFCVHWERFSHQNTQCPPPPAALVNMFSRVHTADLSPQVNTTLRVSFGVPTPATRGVDPCHHETFNQCWVDVGPALFERIVFAGTHS